MPRRTEESCNQHTSLWGRMGGSREPYSLHLFGPRPSDLKAFRARTSLRGWVMREWWTQPLLPTPSSLLRQRGFGRGRLRHLRQKAGAVWAVPQQVSFDGSGAEVRVAVHAPVGAGVIGTKVDGGRAETLGALVRVFAGSPIGDGPIAAEPDGGPPRGRPQSPALTVKEARPFPHPPDQLGVNASPRPDPIGLQVQRLAAADYGKVPGPSQGGDLPAQRPSVRPRRRRRTVDRSPLRPWPGASGPSGRNP